MMLLKVVMATVMAMMMFYHTDEAYLFLMVDCNRSDAESNVIDAEE